MDGKEQRHEIFMAEAAIIKILKELAEKIDLNVHRVDVDVDQRMSGERFIANVSITAGL